MPKPYSLDEIKSKLPTGVSIKEETFISYSRKAVFIDEEFGEFTCLVSSVIRTKYSRHPQAISRRSSELRKTPEFQEKYRKTMIEKYGTTKPFEVDSIKQKFENTMLEKYGVKNAVYSDSLLDKARNNRDSKKAEASRIKTMNDKYGSSNPMHIRDFAIKSMLNRSNRFSVKHWKTSEDFEVIGSWENKVVEFFNSMQIDYVYSPARIILPNDKGYYPDFYLPDQDLWIEVKGQWIEDAREKWELFHSIYPNSELWDKAVLKKKGIL